VNVIYALSKERVYGLFFVMETAITGIVYLDMLQQLDLTLEKCASASALVSQVGRLVSGADSMATSFPGFFLMGIRTTFSCNVVCAFLHYDSSKHCTCPMNKFIYAFKVVKLFL
jgi:hypothetical protein